METMTITCESCGKTYRIPAEKLPQVKQRGILCPNCKARMSFRRTAPGQAAQDTAPNKSGTLKKEIVETIKGLPSMPQIILKAQEIIANPDAGIRELTKVIEKDQAVSARMVKLANSAYYGLSGKIGTIHKAITMLGQKTLREVLLTIGYSGLLDRNLKGYGYESGDLWRHSIAVGIGARITAEIKGYDEPSEAYLAGLIHDAGKLVLDPYILKMKKDFDAFLSDESQTYLNAERSIFGFDHADIAADVCRKWHVPPAISMAVRFHHAPSESKENVLAYIVHLADQVARTGGLGYGDDDYLYLLEDGTLDYLQLDLKSVSDISAQVIENLIHFQN